MRGTWKYSIKIEGSFVSVCKQILLQLYKISDKRVRVLRKKFRSQSLIIDLRGKHETRPQKIKSDIWDLIRKHLKKFPSIKSHYAREKSNSRFFLNPFLNVIILFTSFKDYYKEQTRKTLNISYQNYYELSKSCKYSFSLPKTYVCEYYTECKIKIHLNHWNCIESGPNPSEITSKFPLLNCICTRRVRHLCACSTRDWGYVDQNIEIENVHFVCKKFILHQDFFYYIHKIAKCWKMESDSRQVILKTTYFLDIWKYHSLA